MFFGAHNTGKSAFFITRAREELGFSPELLDSLRPNPTCGNDNDFGPKHVAALEFLREKGLNHEQAISAINELNAYQVQSLHDLLATATLYPEGTNFSETAVALADLLRKFRPNLVSENYTDAHMGALYTLAVDKGLSIDDALAELDQLTPFDATSIANEWDTGLRGNAFKN